MSKGEFNPTDWEDVPPLTGSGGDEEVQSGTEQDNQEDERSSEGGNG